MCPSIRSLLITIFPSHFITISNTLGPSHASPAPPIPIPRPPPKRSPWSGYQVVSSIRQQYVTGTLPSPPSLPPLPHISARRHTIGHIKGNSVGSGTSNLPHSLCFLPETEYPGSAARCGMTPGGVPPRILSIQVHTIPCKTILVHTGYGYIHQETRNITLI